MPDTISGEMQSRQVVLGAILALLAITLSATAPHLAVQNIATPLAMLVFAVALTRIGASIWLAGLSKVAPATISPLSRTIFLVALFICIASLVYGFIGTFARAS